jgi:hypothetical protein
MLPAPSTCSNRSEKHGEHGTSSSPKTTSGFRVQSGISIRCFAEDGQGFFRMSRSISASLSFFSSSLILRCSSVKAGMLWPGKAIWPCPRSSRSHRYMRSGPIPKLSATSETERPGPPAYMKQFCLNSSPYIRSMLLIRCSCLIQDSGLTPCPQLRSRISLC